MEREPKSSLSSQDINNEELIEIMTDQQQHLLQLVEQRNNLASQLENIQDQSARTREIFLKTLGAIEYLEAVGVSLPEPEIAEETTEETTEEG
jgi:hypothetical protein